MIKVVIKLYSNKSIKHAHECKGETRHMVTLYFRYCDHDIKGEVSPKQQCGLGE